MIENKSERLTTLGFGIPNLIKSGKVGYFPEPFLVELGLQVKTALEIEQFLCQLAWNTMEMLFIIGPITHGIL